MPMEKRLESEFILETKVAKNIIGKEYLEYLVNWKCHLINDSTWMNVTTLQKASYSIKDLMRKSS